VPRQLKQGTIIGIEDNPVGQRRLATFFKSWQLNYEGTTDAKQAQAKLTQGELPALVILDQDVFLTSAGKALLAVIESRRIPTIFLTIPHRESVKHVPKQDYIVTINKPLKTSTLIRGITTLFSSPTEKPAVAQPVLAQRKLAEECPLKILLVEDNMVNQKVALRFLDRLGYQADAVVNGLLGVEAVEKGQFDLVLMDLQMPEMDGFEASRKIRRTIPAHRQPKIIALTANALQGDRENCLAAGMDDYISKPVKMHDLSAAIRRQFAATHDISVTEPIV
jgi:CheY-like chemotaxis protein